MSRRGKVKPYKHMTRREYDGIRALFDNGLKNAEVQALSKRSSATVSVIKTHPTWELYKEYQREKNDIKKAKRTGKELELELNDEQPAPIAAEFDFKLLNDNLVALGDKLESFRDAAEKMTIALYALRKQVMHDEDGSWFNKFK